MMKRWKAKEIGKYKKASRSPYNWPTTAPISWIATRLKTNFAVTHELDQPTTIWPLTDYNNYSSRELTFLLKRLKIPLKKNPGKTKYQETQKWMKQANNEAELWTLADGCHLSSMALVWEAFASSWSMSIYTFFSFYNVYLTIDYFISIFYCSVLNLLNGLGLIPSVSFTLSSLS